jgi:hypothetical protein
MVSLFSLSPYDKTRKERTPGYRPIVEGGDVIENKKTLALCGDRCKRRGFFSRVCCRAVVLLKSMVNEVSKLTLATWFLVTLPLFLIGLCCVLRFYVWLLFVPIVALGAAMEKARVSKC